MSLVVTCGPAYEPIDGMRRITNVSTGRLGTALSDAFGAAGYRVICFRAEGSTAPAPSLAAQTLPFGTNDDLAGALEALSRQELVHAVFHAAALCDFRVAGVRNPAGEPVRSAKFATRDGRLTLELEPATKVLPRLRGWFPGARIVGWKYELAGTRREALAAAWRQIQESATDACVLNGAAYGPGFALCEPVEQVIPCESPAQLCQCLLAWLSRKGMAGVA
jgi:phosphopantothenoylcysteine synthetase/decarboxylase